MDKNIPNESGSSAAFNDHEAKVHLAAILDHAPGLIFALNKNLHLLSFNAPFKEIIKEEFGLSIQTGDNLVKTIESINPSIVEEWKQTFAKAFAGEKLNFIVAFKVKQQLFWQFMITPIRHRKEITELACFIRDVTTEKQNELKLKESEERYRVVSENPILGITWVNSEIRLTNANQAFCDLMEGSLEQLINKTPADFTHPDDIKSVLPFFKQLIRGEIDNYRVEKRYITLKKNIKWVELNVASIKNERGELQQIIGVVQDISVRRKAEQSRLQSEANMRYILDNNDTAFVLLDTAFNILTANRVANQWALSEIGVTLDEDDHFLKNFPDLYKPVAEPVLKKVIEGIPHQYEAKYTKKDKSVSWYHVRLNPIAEKKGNIIGLCITADDVSQRIQAASEIKSLNESLERKVTERTTELEEANKELEAFTYSVSHDLLSPLRNIDSFIDILSEDYRNRLDAEGQQTLAVIKRNSTLMGRLINDLLDFSRIGKLPLVKQLVNMNGIVTEVMDELRFMTNKLAAKIKLNDMNPAYCDPQLIKQVWVNLISNAVKYTGTKENPEIEIGSMELDGQIVYYIQDNGVGFDIKYADKLFGVFHRLHKNSNFEGTGVGLAIVHRIITKHGGRIWSDAKVNEGAVFYFTL